MADLYVRSGGDTGSYFVGTYATLGAAAAVDAAGDTIYVAHDHSETALTGTAFAGTKTSPTRIVCVNTSTLALATTAYCGTTTNASIALTGFIYVYGLQLSAGSGNNNVGITTGVASGVQVYEECLFSIPASGTGCGFSISGGSSHAKTVFKNCTFTFSGVNYTYFRLYSTEAEFDGGRVTHSNFYLFRGPTGGDIGNVLMKGVDLSGTGNGMDLTYNAIGGSNVKLIDCILPSAWTGDFSNAAMEGGAKVELHKCKLSGSTNILLWTQDMMGTVKWDTAIYNNAGASEDGSTYYSFSHVASANCNRLQGRFYGPEIVAYNTSTTATTVTVEIIQDTNLAAQQGGGTSYRYKDNEIWLEVMYYDTSGSLLGTWASSSPDVLAAGSDLASSSATWTNSMTTPVKSKLVCTISVSQAGYIHARVVMGVASKTVYVDPLLTIA